MAMVAGDRFSFHFESKIRITAYIDRPWVSLIRPARLDGVGCYAVHRRIKRQRQLAKAGENSVTPLSAIAIQMTHPRQVDSAPK
jgi:hypothetical protein